MHPIQFLLDYPIAFGFLGLAGLYKNIKDIKPQSKVIEYVGAIVGVVLAILGRFISHVLSGVVFFSENAKDLDSWTYSLKYNGGYLSIELLVSIIIIVLIWKPISREIK